MKFRATIQLSGKTATGIPVPEEVVASLGTGKKPAVKVSIGDYTYPSTVAVMGGQFWVPLSAEHRTGAGVNAGEDIEVELVPDTGTREIKVPSDFSEAMDREPAARSFFDGLSYSNKRRFVLSVEGAKTAETRQRRISKAVSLLNEGRVQ